MGQWLAKNETGERFPLPVLPLEVLRQSSHPGKVYLYRVYIMSISKLYPGYIESISFLLDVFIDDLCVLPACLWTGFYFCAGNTAKVPFWIDNLPDGPHIHEHGMHRDTVKVGACLFIKAIARDQGQIGLLLMFHDGRVIWLHNRI